MERYKQLLLENKAWAKEQIEVDPNFFKRHLKVQKPEFLWIGCSDSRVAPDVFTQTAPGEIFIHRNIANVVVHTDLNLLSVLQYAVEVLEIQHIIVCGHYGCGGVKAALSRHSYGIIDKWLRHIKDVYKIHKKEIDAEKDEEQRVNRLIEFNVREQLYNVAKTSIVQNAWKKRKAPSLHGWVYSMEDGVIQPLLEIEPGDPLQDDIYVYDNLAGD